MRSLQRRSVYNGSIVILVLGIILFFILKISSPVFIGSARNFFYPILNFSFKAKEIFSGFGNDEVAKLEAKNIELDAENSVLGARVRELEGGITNVLGEANLKTSTSIVLSQAPASSFDTLVLSRIDGQDINIGSRVVAYSGIYLGEITEIYGRSALARLISYPGLETEAWLESKQLGVTLTGEGGYNLKFTIPKSISVEVGDRILSNTNPQMLIGEVERINEKPTEPLKEVWLRFGFNFRNLRYVELYN